MNGADFMTLKQIIDSKIFTAINIGPDTERMISKPFSCDLLSMAMVKASAGCAWFTVIGNVNTIAVAVHCECSCIVLCEGVKLDDYADIKAIEHGVTVLCTDMPVFEAALKLSTAIDAN